MSQPGDSLDPGYLANLRLAVSAALDYGVVGIERGEERAPAVPLILFAQVRLAARQGIELDVILRRYLVGYTLLSDFLTQEAARDNLADADDYQRLSKEQAALFDRLIPAITEEYKRETRQLLRSVNDRHSERIRSLLAGELLDTSEFQYDFDVWHVGVLAVGVRARSIFRDLARILDCRALLADGASGTIWAWFGRRKKLDPGAIEQVATKRWPEQACLAIGEAGHSLRGWRLTHRQARAAMPLAAAPTQNIVRYSNDALLASIIQDDLLVDSFFQIYLAPLEAAPDGGETLRQTLRAYFAANGNVSSAAAELQVSRKTISKRLAQVERRIGRSLQYCAAELEEALRLQDFWELQHNRPGSQLG